MNNKNYIECPQVYDGSKKSLFMAGGISNCPNWQAEYADLFKDTNLVLINPRRKDFDMTNSKMTIDQIAYEFYHLKRATITSFWFPKETLCPITLLELGKKMMQDKPFFVGIEPGYKRKIDVEEQLKHERPEIKIVYSLENLASQIKVWALK